MSRDRRTVRRRLLRWSVPVVVLLVVVAVGVTVAVLASRSATSAYAQRDVETLRRDVAVLKFVGVFDSAGTDFAAGTLAVLDGRLDEAERLLASSAEERPRCPALANLLLVRETMGDEAVGANEGPLAITRYRSALSVAIEAPDECFATNTDPDPERRAVVADSVPRLERKLALLERPLAPPPPPPPSAAPPPPPPTGEEARETPPPEERRLYPDPADPLGTLRRILENAAAARGGP